MKVVVYSVDHSEKEYLAKANGKKHDITLISNSLTLETAAYAQGKEAVVVFINDDVSAGVINKLADMGVKYIITRSAYTGQIDRETADARRIKISSLQIAIADETIKALDLWQKSILPD
jgi:D-lactate dehydrogenase